MTSKGIMLLFVCLSAIWQAMIKTVDFSLLNNKKNIYLS